MTISVKFRTPIYTQFLISFLVMLVALGYHFFRWNSLSSFVLAIDHHPQLFQDFLGHYYPMARTIDIADRPVAGYFYSAFFAILLSPFRWLTPQISLWVWGGIQLFLALFLSILCQQLLKIKRTAIIIVFSFLFWTSFPLVHNAKWGQVSVLLVLLILLAIYLCQRGFDFGAGAALGVAIAIKFYPVLFVVNFAILKKWRVILWTFVSFIVFYVVIPACIMGLGSWFRFEQATRHRLADASWVIRDINSQYFAHVFLRWFSPLGIKPSHLFLQITSGLGITVFALHLLMIFLVSRRKGSDQWLIGLVLSFVTFPFLIKTSWPHYFVYLPFCQIALATFAVRNRMIQLPIVFPFFILLTSSIIFSSFFLFECFPNWQEFSRRGMMFLSCSSLAGACYFCLPTTCFKTKKV